MRSLHERYGDGPLHLIAVVVSFSIIGYALIELLGRPGSLSFVLFFAGAIVAHDLLAFPVYSALDLLAGRAAHRVRLGPATINYLRVPALLAGFALVVWFPLILSLDPGTYRAATGSDPPDYLGRWLALTAILFLGSGLLYALSRRRSALGRDRARGRPGPHSRR